MSGLSASAQYQHLLRSVDEAERRASEPAPTRTEEEEESMIAQDIFTDKGAKRL